MATTNTNYKLYLVFQLQDGADYRKNHSDVRDFVHDKEFVDALYSRKQAKMTRLFQEFMDKHPDAYQLVSTIKARNLEGVYEIGNVGPASHIKRFPGRSMVSVSVGDLILTPDNTWALVLPCGFAEFDGRDFPEPLPVAA